jgi:hypothetical protein
MGSIVAAESPATELKVVVRPHEPINGPFDVEEGSRLHEPINGSLDLENAPKVRTKLRIFSILIALYVSNETSAVECRY